MKSAATKHKWNQENRPQQTHRQTHTHLVVGQTHLQRCRPAQVSVIHAPDVAVCLGNERKRRPEGRRSLWLCLNSTPAAPSHSQIWHCEAWKCLCAFAPRASWGAVIAQHLQTHLCASPKDSQVMCLLKLQNNSTHNDFKNRTLQFTQRLTQPTQRFSSSLMENMSSVKPPWNRIPQTSWSLQMKCRNHLLFPQVSPTPL